MCYFHYPVSAIEFAEVKFLAQSRARKRPGWVGFEARQFSEPTFLTIPVIFNFGCTWQIPGSHPPMINLSRVWSGSWDVLFLFGCTGLTSGMWDLVSPPGIEPSSLHWEWSLSHWSTREVLGQLGFF